LSALLEVENLQVTFGRGRKQLHAVNDVSFSVGQSETVGLVGESGSGKSTIGRSILGLVRPSAGTVLYQGRDMVEGWRRRRYEFARYVQVVFQDPNSSLNPLMTIGQILEEPLRAAGQMSRRDAAARVREMLDAVGLPQGAQARYSAEFSGGQRQRVAIARALVLSPRLVVCDEPVSALDLSTQAQVINLLSALRQRTGVSYLFISHDLSVVRHLADRTVVLYRGQVMEAGPAQDVADAPLHPYTAALTAASPVIDVDQQQELRERRREAIAVRVGISLDVPGCPFSARCPFTSDVCVSTRPRRVPRGASTVACHLYDPDSGHPRAGQDVPAS
jgi:oligopeptide/dipeptide ABC transporter ATP-binding protein